MQCLSHTPTKHLDNGKAITCQFLSSINNLEIKAQERPGICAATLKVVPRLPAALLDLVPSRSSFQTHETVRMQRWEGATTGLREVYLNNRVSRCRIRKSIMTLIGWWFLVRVSSKSLVMRTSRTSAMENGPGRISYSLTCTTTAKHSAFENCMQELQPCIWSLSSQTPITKHALAI